MRALKGVDIRDYGSGNIGASNVWRTFGVRYGLPVVLLDVGKGFAPAFAATLVAGHLAGVLAGAAAMVGHARPLFMRFERGGKMVATAGGAFFGVAPYVALVAMGVWFLVFGLFRYASVASIVGALSCPVTAVLLGEPWPVVVFTSLAAAAVVLLHRANLRRLLAGTEPRFSAGRLSLRRP